jgi:hypothetical protein
MAYFLDLFSPQTYEAYKRSPRDVTGFRQRQANAATRVAVGDQLLCYLTSLGRWFGILEVVSAPFVDDSPIFLAVDDPFVVRFRVKPLIVLEPIQAVPIREDEVWNRLSFTREHKKGSTTWTGKLRGSLVPNDEADGEYLAGLIGRQAGTDAKAYPYDEEEYRKLTGLVVRRADRDVTVTVPDAPGTQEEAPAEDVSPETAARESHRMQALIADIGERMGMSIWVPRGDRQSVSRERKFEAQPLLERLPLNYNEATLSTIENIDVLWIHHSSITRAFEVEQTTSIYSGLLRMADLLALQPNMDIKLHIVAPSARRDKVFREIQRPVFSLLERGPLAESCTLLPYESLIELSSVKHLEHMGVTVLDEYAEEAL